MKLPREVKIRIHADGKVEIETEGFRGASCEELSAFLEQVLAGENAGDGEIERIYKPSYYQRDVQADTHVEDELE